MSEVATAFRATDFNPDHAVAEIPSVLQRARLNRRIEGRPTAPRIKLRLAPKQGLPASCARINSCPMLVQKGRTSRGLRPVAAKHPESFWRQVRPSPILLKLGVAVHGRGFPEPPEPWCRPVLLRFLRFFESPPDRVDAGVSPAGWRVGAPPLPPGPEGRPPPPVRPGAPPPRPTDLPV
jgi:hypothetical protein